MESLMLINPERVRELREAKGWSQELLAEAAGLGLRTIQRIEAEGGASKESVMCIAAALEVAVTELKLANGVASSPEVAPFADQVPAKPPLLIRLSMIGIYSRKAALGFMWLSIALCAIFLAMGYFVHSKYNIVAFIAFLASLAYFSVAHWMLHRGPLSNTRNIRPLPALLLPLLLCQPAEAKVGDHFPPGRNVALPTPVARSQSLTGPTRCGGPRPYTCAWATRSSSAPSAILGATSMTLWKCRSKRKPEWPLSARSGPSKVRILTLTIRSMEQESPGTRSPR